MADDLRPAPDLYEEDFYVWTRRQAEALRRARPKDQPGFQRRWTLEALLNAAN